MKIQKLLIFAYLFAFSLLSIQGFAQKPYMHDEQADETSFEKIYLSPDRLMIYPEGIFYLNEAGDVAQARLISADASGIYIVAAAYKCPGCGRYNRDNVCGNPKCPLYGQ